MLIAILVKVSWYNFVSCKVISDKMLKAGHYCVGNTNTDME